MGLEQGEGNAKGCGGSLGVAGSHAGSRAPGERSLRHPERGWEKAPKHN